MTQCAAICKGSGERCIQNAISSELDFHLCYNHDKEWRTGIALSGRFAIKSIAPSATSHSQSEIKRILHDNALAYARHLPKRPGGGDRNYFGDTHITNGGLGLDSNGNYSVAMIQANRTGQARAHRSLMQDQMLNIGLII